MVHVPFCTKYGWDFITSQLPFRKRKYDRLNEAGEMKVLMPVNGKTSDLKTQIAEDLTEKEKEMLVLDGKAG